MRLAKYLAHAGVASRRSAERLVQAGRVAVGGEVVTDPARDVDDSTDVRVDGRQVAGEPLEHHAVNKPIGVVSTADDPWGRPKVVDLVNSTARLYPVGRLDIDTTGLIIVTNDGELANLLTHPRHEVEKTYAARVKGRIDDYDVRRLVEGVRLEDGQTAPARVRLLERHSGHSVIELTIHEGRKRQVRRMCEAVGHPVEELERTGLGPLELGNLRPGSSRRLTLHEVDALRRAAGER